MPDAPLPGFVSLCATRQMTRNSTDDDGYMATDDFGLEKHLRSVPGLHGKTQVVLIRRSVCAP
jgi:hypothetical protein